MIKLEHVSKAYQAGIPALNDISLYIGTGEFVFVVGDSGSGKSTLIKLLLKELEPTEGTIKIGSEDLGSITHRQIPKFRRKIGVVFQDFRLLQDLNVYENVAFALKVVEASNREIKKKVPQMLSMVGLAAKYRSLPRQLSGGEQQRVALARALIVEPKLCLLDEPFCNLDAALRTRMRHELKRLQKDLGLTMVFVTHDQEEAIILADRIAIMDQGELVQNDAPLDLCRRPASPFVAEFMDLESLVWTEDGRLLKIIKR